MRAADRDRLLVALHTAIVLVERDAAPLEVEQVVYLLGDRVNAQCACACGRCPTCAACLEARYRSRDRCIG